MKKISLIFYTFCIALSSVGQEGEKPIEATKLSPEILNELNRTSLERLNAIESDREEINGWVSFELNQYNYTHGPDAFYSYWRIITPDSLPRVAFEEGLYRSFVHGFGQMFDPTAVELEFSGTRLSSSDAYEIDSIGFPSMYERVNHNGIDDTLIITVAVTDKKTEAGNPYEGLSWWSTTGLLVNDIYVPTPSYVGSPEHGNHHGLTGVSEPGENVEIQQYKFALTDADTEIIWRSFPVDVVAEPDQIVYTFVEFQTSFEATIEDTAYIAGGEGVATTNSYRMVYDYPVAEQTGYFFDLYREDEMSYNASFSIESNGRYSSYEGDYEWLNSRLLAPSWWGMRFEYYMSATSSLGVNNEESVEGINIYPNPAHNNVLISLNDNQEISGNIEISDIDGRVVYSSIVQHQNQLNIDLSTLNLTAGIYVISIQNDGGILKEQLIIQ